MCSLGAGGRGPGGPHCLDSGPLKGGPQEGGLGQPCVTSVFLPVGSSERGSMSAPSQGGECYGLTWVPHPPPTTIHNSLEVLLPGPSILALLANRVIGAPGWLS